MKCYAAGVAPLSDDALRSLIGRDPSRGWRAFIDQYTPLILGLIRERFTQEQRESMDQKMPPPAVEMWNGFGEKAFGELIAEVGPPLG